MSAAIHILRGPDGRRYTGEREVRWCFGCCEYQVHHGVILFDTEASPGFGWYGPLWINECSGCGHDLTRMF